MLSACRVKSGISICVIPVLGLPCAAAAAAATWAIDRTPNPAGSQGSVLSEVSCPSASDCMAVGHFTGRGGAGAALAERWNGATWSITAPRSPVGAATTLLFDVACPSRTLCVAVGSTTNRAGATIPLAERWNGSRWGLQRTVTPRRASADAIAYLGGVSCASATSCTAVGYSGNGAGTKGGALVERWDGGRWTIERTPHVSGVTASFLSGVACPSPRSCAAVGLSNRANGVAASLAERWNGSSWAVQPTPDPAAARSARLVSVSCSSPRSCTAVGSFTIVTGVEIMLAGRWDGTRWTIERTRYPAGARFVALSGVSCVAPRTCTAVGSFNDVAGIDVTLAETQRGAVWTIERPPNPRASTGASLTGVSCPRRSVCIAVGSFTDRDGTGVTLAERSR